MDFKLETGTLYLSGLIQFMLFDYLAGHGYP
jgi:hypothetical protein